MEHFKPVRGLGLAASALVGLVSVANVAGTAAAWFTYDTVRDHRAGEATAADLRTAEKIGIVVGVPSMLLTIAAAVVFISWMYTARLNAERLTSPQEHRHSRVWVCLGWFVPVVNLWFPKQIIDDIWRASDPRQQGVPLRHRVRPTLTTRWWIALLLTGILGRGYSYSHDERGGWTTESFLTVATLSTLSSVAAVVGAIFAVQVVRRISEFQSAPLPPR